MIRRAIAWLLRYGPALLAAAVVLAAFMWLTWFWWVEHDGPLWWRAVFWLASMLLVAKGLLFAADLSQPVRRKTG